MVCQVVLRRRVGGKGHCLVQVVYICTSLQHALYPDVRHKVMCDPSVHQWIIVIVGEAIWRCHRYRYHTIDSWWSFL